MRIAPEVRIPDMYIDHVHTAARLIIPPVVITTETEHQTLQDPHASMAEIPITILERHSTSTATVTAANVVTTAVPGSTAVVLIAP